MSDSPESAPAATSPASVIVIPPRKRRAVSIGVVIAIVFASLSVGFAVGRQTAPTAGSGSSSSRSGLFGGTRTTSSATPVPVAPVTTPAP